MESPLSSLTLTAADRAAIQEATLQDLATQDWKAIQAAIFITDMLYIYKRRVPDTVPQTYSYKCLSPESLQRAFHLDQIDTGWLLPGIVRCGSSTQGNWAVLFIEPQHHILKFAGQDTPLTTNTLPGLVMLGLETTYWLWAISTPSFDATAQAYNPPLPNVESSDKICWGTNLPPAASAQTIHKAWNLFMTSPFNNHLTTHKSRKFPDVTVQLRKLSTQKKKLYPMSDLVPANDCKVSIGTLIEDRLAWTP